MSLPQEIYESIENETSRWHRDNNFNRDTRKLMRDDGLTLWIGSNPRLFLKIYEPKNIELPWRWRCKLWKLIRKKGFSKNLKYWQVVTISDLMKSITLG